MKSVTIIGANSYIARNLIQGIADSDAQIKMYLYDREETH